MNERIKELFNKASVYAYEQNPGENSYGRPVDENKYEEDRYTKFAELIVKMCADAADMYEGKSDCVGDCVAEYMGYGQEEGVTEWRAK